MEKEKVYDLKLFINNFKMNPKQINQIFNKIENILNENGILLDDISFMDNDFYKDVKLTLNNVVSELGHDKETCLNSHYINWDAVSRYSNMSEGFIRYFKTKLNWTMISKRYLNNEFKFTKKFKEEFNIELLYYKYNNSNNDIPYSNEAFKLIDDSSNFPMRGKPLNNYDDSTQCEYIDSQDINNILNSSGDINTLLNNALNSIFSDNNRFQRYQENNHNNISEEPYKNITEVYIDINNYKKILIDIDNYDRGMWSFLSRKCNLSTRFIELFEKKILFEGLIDNPYFNDMMKDNKFFDKYINIFKNIQNNKKTINMFKSKKNKNGISIVPYKGKEIPIVEL